MRRGRWNGEVVDWFCVQLRYQIIDLFGGVKFR